MSDSLETLFQNMGPYVPALWAGQREGLNNQAALQEQALQVQRLKDAQQTYAQKERTNPLDVINKQYTNEGLAAENPGKAALSKLHGIQANTAEATQAGDIAKKQSDNALSLLTNKANQSAMIADELSKVALSIDDLPALPGVRESAINQHMERLGVPKGQYGHLLANVPPDQIPKKLMSYSDSFRKNASSYKNKMEEEQLKQASQEKIAAGHDAATRYVADQKAATATAKVGDPKDVIAHIMKAKPTAEQAAVMFNIAANVEQDDQKRALYKKLADDAAQKKGEWINAGKPDIAATTGNAVPVNTITPFNLAPKGKPLSVDEKRAEAARLLGITK
jgi:hypothetical protein